MKRENSMATASGPACSRGSAYMLGRLFVATVAALLFSLVISSPAYALSTNPGVEINGWSLTAFGMDGYEGYLVYAPDKYSAAAMALGYSWDDVRQFTDDQKAYMSNESTGGDFYVFASNFEKLSRDTPSIGDVPYAWAMGYLSSNQVIWGGRVFTDAYAVNTTRDMRSDALQKLEGILDGDVGGGTTPGEPSGGYATWYGLNFYTSSYTASKYFYTAQFDSNGFVSGHTQTSSTYRIDYRSSFNASSEFKLYVNSTIKDKIDAQLALGRTVIVGAGISVNSSQTIVFGVLSIPSDVSYVIRPEYEDLNGHGPCNYHIYMSQGTTVYGSTANSMSGYMYGDYSSPVLYTNSNSNCNFNARTVSSQGYTSVAGNDFALAVFTSDNPNGGGGGGEPVVPPTHWPDPPENPSVDPPSVPEPPSGPTVEPPTIPPQPTPVYPTPPVVVEPTVPATPDLSDILEALNEHCIHLQDALHREAENLDTDMRAQIGWLAGAISDSIESLDGDIELYFKHLEDYLYDLFHWLNDQLDFSFGEYDDSSVLYWLRMIYSKLGRGGPTTKPTDPVTDPFGIGDWIKQLIDNFLLDLIAIGAGDLADVIADFRDLARKFPFSVPWDLAAMLALLVAQPVTPVIDFPWYSFTANGLVSTTVHMDLSAWNATMEPIRLMEKLAFCMLLASRSKDLLDFIRLGRGDA